MWSARSFTYNGQAPAQQGLWGTYTYDPNANHVVDAGEPSLLVRLDPTINFNWYPTPPVPGIGLYVIKWAGYVSVPTSGSWQLGALFDAGIRVAPR